MKGRIVSKIGKVASAGTYRKINCDNIEDLIEIISRNKEIPKLQVHPHVQPLERGSHTLNYSERDVIPPRFERR